MEYIIKRDITARNNKWIRFNLDTGKFEEPLIFGMEPKDLLNPDKCYTIKEGELK